MIGGVRIRTALGAGGRTRVVELTPTPPLAAKLVGDTVHLIGAAAAPLDGDRITIELDLAPGTSLTVRTVAATMAWPGRAGLGPSVMDIRAQVGEGATLRWLPEPVVPVQGCRHELHTEVWLAPDARLVWREEIILGRVRERPGSLRAHTRVERGGAALLDQLLTVDGTVDGAAATHLAASVLGGARATGSVLVVGPGAPDHCATVSEAAIRGAVVELEGGGRLASAAATSAAGLRAWLDAREAGLTDGGAWPASPTGPSADPARIGAAAR